MRQLIYTSLATAPLSDNDILDLLKEAQSNNSKHNITGILIFFLDYLFNISKVRMRKLSNLF
jgi:hypothetical protein